MVVIPVKTRNVPTTVSSLTQGASTRTMPVQEIVLAVAPEEVAPLAEAIDLKYEITCAARSGRPEPTAAMPPSTAHPRPLASTAQAAPAGRVRSRLHKRRRRPTNPPRRPPARPIALRSQPARKRLRKPTSRPDWTPWPTSVPWSS